MIWSYNMEYSKKLREQGHFVWEANKYSSQS